MAALAEVLSKKTVVCRRIFFWAISVRTSAKQRLISLRGKGSNTADCCRQGAAIELAIKKYRFRSVRNVLT
ncbi:hypothetical protein [Uliginosibacterium gangwonense]|uniref:hypothetical protein n=1 Tax=Uliginosibacterium gangwonense TaxID=392736 RepID=UPI00036E3E88|nr:hypothetical protein [Uliginosibacterium gangwonense]